MRPGPGRRPTAASLLSRCRAALHCDAAGPGLSPQGSTPPVRISPLPGPGLPLPGLGFPRRDGSVLPTPALYPPLTPGRVCPSDSPLSFFLSPCRRCRARDPRAKATKVRSRGAGREDPAAGRGRVSLKLTRREINPATGPGIWTGDRLQGMSAVGKCLCAAG